jgi:NAD(P)-dependent dehydrogenase (short-subunit alcohol dehydrogenase family)
MSGVALVSGASRGIGRAVAETLAAEGWQVSAGLRNPASAPPGLHAARYEARDAGSAASWVAEAVRAFGRVDAVVACAGQLLPGTAHGDDEAALEDMLEVNLKGPLRLARAAWPHLVASGRGRIVTLASLSGKRVANEHAAYAISKFALVGATHALRREGWDAGIRATAICPSFVATEMGALLGGPPPEAMTQPRDLARLVATLLTLPPSASVAELTVQCRFEAQY